MRLPLTIWRFTLLELWRLLLLTGGVLVTVISFALAVRLSAEGRLDPLDTIKYMVLAMPPMLQYALPFAAGFGATLSYHRMSQDHELTAAASGGVSHRALLIPAAASGVALALLMWLLMGQVIPRFLQSLDRMVTRDAVRLVRSTIESGQPLKLNNTMVYADGVYPIKPEEGSGATDVLVLTKVIAVTIAPDGSIRSEATAAQAILALYPVASGEGNGDGRGGASELSLVLRDAQYVDPAKSLGTMEKLTLYATLPGVFNDDPKYLTDGELRDLPSKPDQMNFIDVRRRDLAYHLAEREAIAGMEASFKKSGSATLTDGAGSTYVIEAAGIGWDREKDRWELSPQKGGQTIEVKRWTGSRSGPANVVMRAASGGLTSDLGKDRSVRHLELRLEMEVVSTSAGGTERGSTHKTLSMGNLLPADNQLEALLERPSRELLKEARQRAQKNGSDPFITGPADELARRLKRLEREVVSKRHERWAHAAAGLIMVLAGALTAMRLGGSLPLGVYLWSFFPALLSLVTISAGQQMTHRVGMGGLALLWGGVGILAVYALSAFVAVRRH